MRLLGKILFIISFFTLFIINVYAEEDTQCGYSSKATLHKSAYNVDANYTIRKDDNNNYYFQFNVYNITDDIYVSITNDINDEVIQISNNMTTNNNYSFNVNDIHTVINYVVHIRAIKYGCNDELRKINISKPRYNDLSEIAVCKDDIMLEYSYCKQWVTKYFTDTREEVIEKINRQYNKYMTKPVTECIECKTKDANAILIKKQKAMRLAIIIGLVVAIMMDIGIIVLLIIRLKRYDI